MDLRENLVVLIGCPMFDVTARIPYDFLRKYNLKSNNATSYNQDYLNIFDDLENYNPTFTIGGTITHTVLSMQSVLQFPRVCCYLGAIGKDNFGREIHRKLEEDEINVLFEEIEEESTGRCAVLLFENNRSFVTDLAASKFLSEEFLKKVQNIVNQGKYYYMSAFFFRISSEIVWKICNAASKEKKTFIFNIGAPFLCSQYAREFKKILPHVKLLFGNEEEARHLANSLGCYGEDIREVTSFLHSQCDKTSSKTSDEDNLVIITRADKSVVLARNDEIEEYEVPTIEVQKYLDTNGAGDYFVGGFLAKFVQGKSIEECVNGGLELSCKLIQNNSLKYEYFPCKDA